MSAQPLITVAVPSFNQGRYLNDALESIFEQQVAVEVFVMDGGSTDNSVAVIKKWAPQLTGWRSETDGGQAAAINAAIAQGSAPYVCWLNSDDWWLDRGLLALTQTLEAQPRAAFAYGRAWNVSDPGAKVAPVYVRPFDARAMAVRCLVSQPATLIRRSAWEQVGGLNEKHTWRWTMTCGGGCLMRATNPALLMPTSPSIAITIKPKPTLRGACITRRR